ncbi:Uncharacterised protein [Prevotella intermedia]|nr:Uncharacterised protein [Prevotella intermedia]
MFHALLLTIQAICLSFIHKSEISYTDEKLYINILLFCHIKIK